MQAAEKFPSTGGTLEIQVGGKWDRKPGVATRYELERAIGTLLTNGKITIVGGLLALPTKRRGEVRMKLALSCVRKTKEEIRRERWAKQDADLERYCRQMKVNKDQSRQEMELLDASIGSTFIASASRGAPRRDVAKYVLLELSNGPCEFDALVTSIHEKGGWHWEQSDLDDARHQALAKVAKKAKR